MKRATMAGNQNATGNRGKSYKIVLDEDETIVDRDVERQFLRELEGEGLLVGAKSNVDHRSDAAIIDPTDIDIGPPQDCPVDDETEVDCSGDNEDFDREPTLAELEEAAAELDAAGLL